MPVRAVAVPAGISIASNSITAKAAHSYTTDINGILYVKKGATGTGDSWNNAMGELADALLFAKNNNAVATNQQVKQIWVAGGTYTPMYSPADNNFGTPDVQNNAFLLVKDVKLYGGFAGTETSLDQRNLSLSTNKSILSGDLDHDGTASNNDAYHVLISVRNTSTDEINGFTITGGNANNTSSSIIVNGLTIEQDSGAGIYNSVSSLIINNCKFTGSLASDYGGAIYNFKSSVSITQNSFSGNKANISGGAIYNFQSSSPVIADCTFAANTALNSGGAIYNNQSHPKIANSIFRANTANRAGAIFNSDSGPKIYNTLFVKNNALTAGSGAIYHNNNSPGNGFTLANCIVYGNTGGTTSWAGGIHSTSGCNIYNSVIWGNQGGQLTGTFITKNSLVQGFSSTADGNLDATNINVAQLFNNPNGADGILGTADDNFNLIAGSPLIEKGDNTLYTSIGGNLSTDKDLAGNARFQGTKIDIGAFEMTLLPQTITVTDMVKTYGDTPFVPTATASSGLEVSYLTSDNSIAEPFQDTADGNKWKLKIKRAGQVNVRAKQAGDATYNPAPDVFFTLTIEKAPLTITAHAKSKESGAADPVLTYTTNGLLNGDTPNTIFFGTLQRTIGEAAGTYPITQGTLGAHNYTISYTGADFTITNAPGDFITVWDMTKVSTGTNISINITTLPSPNNKVKYFWTAPDGSYNSGTVTTSGSHVITTIPANKPRITLHIKPENLASVVIYNDPRIIDVAQWGTAEWRTMQSAFLVCPNLNITATDIPDLSRVTDMRNMFADCSSLNGPANIGSWNTSNVTNMIQLFGRATRFNQDISNWDTQNVTTMAYMFREARAFNQNIGNWNTEKVTDMEAMFDNASVFNQDISNWNTANVTNMSKMFSSAPVFNQNIGSWNTSKVTNMSYMFQYTGAFNGDISSWNTANVTNMWGMFYSTGAFNQNIGNWDTSNVTYMGGMFWNAQAFNQDISSWNTAKVTSMAYMFADSRAFNKDIGNWNTSNVTDMAYMFRANQAFNKDIGNWNTSKVTNMAYMFYGASLFNQNIGGWQLNPAVNMTHMLSYSRMDCQNYSFTLNGWANNPNTPSGRTLGVMGKQYGTNAVAARTVLTGTKGWTITGDSPSGQSCGLSQTITATDMVKTYGDAPFVPMATASSNLEVSYTSADNNIAEAFQDSADGNKWKIKIKKAGQVNIFAKQAGNETYNPATNVIFKLTINKAALTVTANALSKEYGTIDPVLTYATTGLVNNDDQTVLTGTLSRAAGEAVGIYTISQGTLDAENYSITYTGADFTITKATLNIVADAKSKVYGSVDPALTYTVTGLANGDDQSIITGALTRAAGENIGTYAINQGSLATTANYYIVYTAADFDITKATLIIRADAKSKVYGTADPALTYTVTGLENGDDQIIITGALTRVAGENIGTYAIKQGTLSTTANYDIVYTGADLTITKATLNIVADAKSKVYGSSDPALTYTVTGFENGDDQSIITGNLTRVAGENIGTYAIKQGTLSTTANYDIVYTGADLTITKATLNIVADAKSKVYGSADPALTYTVTGFANGDDQSIITGNLTRVAGENIGTYAIEQGTLATTANYDITYTAADLTITKATLNIVADAKTKVYGSGDPALTYTVTGFANGDDQSVITGALTRVAGENIGTYAINQGSLATTANYDITYTGADFTITKATLNIVADAKSKVYGTSDPALTYTVTGFENGDDQSIITGTLIRIAGESVGTYNIEQGTLVASNNYDIVYTAADFDITKATLNIVAEAKSKVYGSADPALTYTVTGLENGDGQSIITGALIRVAGEAVGTYNIGQGTLATTANYDITFTSADFNITKATLNIVADAKSKVYGSTDPVLTYTVTGFENGDDQSVITGNLTRVAGENIGTYAIEQGTLSTTANYDITYTGADFTITKATLNIVADAKTKVYGSADPAFTYTVTGLANGDDQSIITGNLTRVAGENIGTYAILQGTLGTTANYDIVYTGADFNITKATLIIRANAKTKVYGSADPALTYTITGFENGDDQSVITGALTRVSGENIGTYAILQGTLGTTANYDIVYTGADFNITKATLNIVADAKSKVYGSADPALTYTVTGLANGDDQSVITGALTRTAGEAVGTYNIEQGTLATTANYDITYTGADLTITKATLNIVADVKSKVYGSADPELTYTVTGFENGDDQSIITGALTRVAGEAVGTYSIEQGTLTATANYDIVYTGADFDITKATLIIRADAKSKVYGSADPVLTYTVTGFENGDDQSIITGTLTRVSGENIGTYAIEQGTLATTANYDITYTAADFNITKATLNIVADAKSKVYGSADPALTYTVTGLENGDDNSIITGALTRVAGENIGTYAIEQGTLATTANYDLVYTAADFDITKATLIIRADAKSKVYGSADPVLTYTVTGFENGDDQSIITGTLIRTAGEAIGTYAINQGTLSTTANYDITYTGADFNITKATLNIVADAKSKVYGSADPALTYTVTGLANGDDQSIITGALTRVAGENIGTYAINQGSLATTANYDIVYTAADFDITKATLIIRADAKTKVYGSADPALTYTVTGLANGDDQSVITGALTRVAGENIGTYAIEQGTLATTANYDIVYTAADFTITKATLNIVADAKSKVYGSADQALTYTATGFVNNDDQTVLTGTLSRAAGEAVGTYNIEQGTLATTANYDIIYTGADFDITKATLIIRADAKTKVYGTADPALTYTVTGLANGDDQSVITGALTRVAGEAVGIYNIEQGTLATTANYDITYTGADFNITKATLNIVADAKSKVYGSADPGLTYTVTGFENGDNQSIITGALSRTAGEAVGTYKIEQGTLATTANYDITYTGADFNITKATLNIVADAKSKVYGTTDPALTYTVTGFENSDNQSIITGALSRTAGEAVGTYKIEQGTLATTANYDITYTAADFNITKATLNIVADAKSKVYGSADPALTYTVTGFANGDDQSILTGALSRTAGEVVGTYNIEQGTLATTANYDITYTAADFNITKATLNIVAEAKTKVYGSVDPALTYTVTGFANNDDQSIITGALTRVAGEAVGTYNIEQGTLATTANYDITYTAADFNITKATLNIVANAKSKVYGSADPALTYTVTGLENGDDQSIITGALIRIAGESVGTYNIEQGTLGTTANYDITYTAADFTITKATLSIVADAKTKVYGSADPALTYTVTGFENGDDQSIITGALTRVAGEAVGTYSIEQGTLTTTANYDITFTGADFNITKATLNIVADAKSKVYGSADPALTYTVTGLANGDDQSIITGALTRVAGEAVGTYNIEQGTLATTANYDITYTAADFTITKATLNIVADAKNKVYGSADPALTYTVTGFANNDDQSIITGNLARVVGEEAGIYPIEQGTLSAGANYHITYTGADFTITGGTLLISANPKSKVYGTADPVLTYTVTGFVNGDDQSIIEGTLSRVAGEQAGNYTIKQGTLSAKGYIIKYTEAPFVISKAKLKIVADDKTKFYGTTDPALTYKVTGLVNGDNPSVVKGSLTRTAGEAVGTYIIRQGTLEAGTNYDINFTQAEFVISKITLYTISLHDATFTYDGSRKSILISGDLPAGVTVTYTGNGQTNAGSYIVTADIDGGSNYNSFSLQATLKINKAKQIITFKEIVPVYRDAGTVKLDISSNSSLPIKIYSDNKLVAEVTGDQEVTVRGVGLALITAEQSGNDNYIAAEPVIRQLRVRNEEGAKLPLRVHKAVSPNGDGINEYLRIEGIDEYPDNQIVIFDANGNLIQKIRGYVNETNCFNGIKASRKVPSGTYFYVLEVKIDDKWQHEKGFFVVRY
ncbi:bacterial surface protein 26-residue PARCEL repeat (3 repeats) [Sphingobacterium spiritivorum ATCC 33861]|uniref:Bacterial surface protein 26-residue PARCEL repeat (3 repeats) n=7 Tax=Sphingobacterium spiritivorum TaxID=258 RepID=D7VPP4_SPHSI|nr:bacterial surface protein 26-residue PARCEL repeat (3 repeats) [Sphingobacterium spiritivorum ATCC 33861]